MSSEGLDKPVQRTVLSESLLLTHLRRDLDEGSSQSLDCYIQVNLVISKSKGMEEILRDIGSST